MLYSPLVRAFSSISCRRAAMALMSVLSSTPLIVSLLMSCPSVSCSTRCSNRAKSDLASLILSKWKDTELSISANLPFAASRSRRKFLRSDSKVVIFLSSLAFSKRSVLPESTATYSEKFIPLSSSILPSSMVRLPSVFVFN